MEKKKVQFFRTIAGKAVLFLIINIAIFADFLCACAAFVCIEEDLYSRTEAEYIHDRNEDDIFYFVYDDARALLDGHNASYDYVKLRVLDDSDKVLASSSDFDIVKSSAGTQGKYENFVFYTYDARIVYDSEGNYVGMYSEYFDDECEIIDATIEAYVDPSSYSHFSELLHL